MEKYKLKKIEDKIRIGREIEILKKLKHPNIVQLYSVIEDEKQIFLIMEYIKGKELFQYILDKKKLSEEESCMFFQQMISGIEYLHKLKIAHRDIKSENMIIEQKTKNLKIIDFGLSNTYGDKPNEMLSTACGSPCYAAPEMLSGKIYKGGGVDIWSVGVVLFSMICGYLPFHEETNKEMYKKIIEGKYSVPGFVSNFGTELIHNLLNTNPKKRIKISKIKKHYWIKFHSNGLNSEGKSLFNIGLFIDKYVIPIDEEVVNDIEKLFKIPKMKTRIEVLSNNSNDYTSLYYLMVNKKINNGKKSIADFKSDLFLNYLKDKKNYMSNYKNDINNVLEARKMGVLFEQEKIYVNNDKKLTNTESNVKSQDNIYNIYFKNNTNNKMITLSNFNSSLNLKINPNKKIIIKAKKINSLTNNIINVNLIKKLKNKININIENNKESNTDRAINKASSKTTRNNNNLVLKKICTNNSKNKIIKKNHSDINNIKDSNITNSLINNAISSINKKIQAQNISYSHKNINRIIKKNKIDSKNNINEKNKKRNNNDLKIVKPIKYSHDEIEEEKYIKTIEQSKEKKRIKQNKNENKNNNILNIKNLIKINKLNQKNEKKQNNENDINKDVKIINDILNKNNIKYKESISPSIDAKKTIYTNTENNKPINYKTMDSFSLQTINQEKYEISSNNYSIKNIVELTYTRTISEKEEEKKSNIIRKDLLSYKKKKELKNKQKTSKLLKNFNLHISKFNNKKNSKNKNINTNNNNINISYKNKKTCNTYKKSNFIKNNTNLDDYLKKHNIEQNLIENILLSKDSIENNTLNNNNYILTKIEDISQRVLTNNISSFNKKKDSNYKLNYRDKINQIINNINTENDNNIKNNTINNKKFKSVENHNKYKSNINKNKINDYKKSSNKLKQNLNLKRLNTANTNLKKGIYFKNYKINNKIRLSSFKTTKLLKKENIINHNNSDNKNIMNKKRESESIFHDNNNNNIYQNLLYSDIKIPINNNIDNNTLENNVINNNNTNYKNIINNNGDILKNLKQYFDKQDTKIDNNDQTIEPFDLNCIFYLPKKMIKNQLMCHLKSLKYKVKQINSYKYQISYDENNNVYEFFLSKNYLGIIKFKRIKGNYNTYIYDIRKIIQKFK